MYCIYADCFVVIYKISISAYMKNAPLWLKSLGYQSSINLDQCGVSLNNFKRSFNFIIYSRQKYEMFIYIYKELGGREYALGSFKS